MDAPDVRSCVARLNLLENSRKILDFCRGDRQLILALCTKECLPLSIVGSGEIRGLLDEFQWDRWQASVLVHAQAPHSSQLVDAND